MRLAVDWLLVKVAFPIAVIVILSWQPLYGHFNKTRKAI
jgi:hypothetical protein